MKIKVLRQATNREKAHIWRKIFLMTDVEYELHMSKSEKRKFSYKKIDEVLTGIINYIVNKRTPENGYNVFAFNRLLSIYEIYPDEKRALSLLFKCIKYCHNKGIWKVKF